jgi:lysophospholipid acyltransferase (LPLAT)-like uncharacterized protein
VPGSAEGTALPRSREASARLRFLLGFFSGLLVRIWVATLRVRVEMPEAFVATAGRAIAFWHGQQMALLGARRLARRAVVLVSRSRDGDLQAGVMTALGFRVVRGSSSRGGAVALSTLVSALSAGDTIALSVDGPRGPRHVAKPGVAAAALAAGSPLYVAASACRSARVLSSAWDGFEIPLPFSRVAVVVGEAPGPCVARNEPAVIAAAIDACRERALALLDDAGPRA